MSKKLPGPSPAPSDHAPIHTTRSTKPALRILIASGVNLDLLGKREPEHYGHATLPDMEILLRAQASAFKFAVDLTFFQTNDEAKYLDMLTREWDGAVLNPGAWTHTSLALADRLAALNLRFVEVHLSKVTAREPIRQRSFLAPAAIGSVSGFGIDSYRLGLLGLLDVIRK